MATEYTGIPGTLTLTADLCEDDDAPSAALLHGPLLPCSTTTRSLRRGSKPTMRR